MYFNCKYITISAKNVLVKHVDLDSHRFIYKNNEKPAWTDDSIEKLD